MAYTPYINKVERPSAVWDQDASGRVLMCPSCGVRNTSGDILHIQPVENIRRVVDISSDGTIYISPGVIDQKSLDGAHFFGCDACNTSFSHMGPVEFTASYNDEDEEDDYNDDDDYNDSYDDYDEPWSEDLGNPNYKKFAANSQNTSGLQKKDSYNSYDKPEDTSRNSHSMKGDHDGDLYKTYVKWETSNSTYDKPNFQDYMRYTSKL